MSGILAGCVMFSIALGTPSDTTHVIIDFASDTTRTITGDLWGSNELNLAFASVTVDHPVFQQLTRENGIRLIRWPGGNNADNYNWKTRKTILPGYRQSDNDSLRVDIARIIQFCSTVDAELTVTVNFGTMTAEDAADLVEFLNGPASSPWGQVRAEMGFPDPIGVRYFEIGNEENQNHMWYYSWTAENPEKYFLGGDEERRGIFRSPVSGEYFFKGDFFRATAGVQIYHLRFPPVRDVQIYWADLSPEDVDFLTSSGNMNQFFDYFQAIPQVETFAGIPPDSMVFRADTLTGAIQFGDGTEGQAPSDSSWFLVEYTTLDHDGFLDFARAMRQVDSSIPIQIGAASYPIADGQLVDLPQDTLRAIFTEMDFRVLHQYNVDIPVNDYDNYQYRRQMAQERLENLVIRQQLMDSILIGIGLPDRTVGLAVTEWNLFLHDDYQWLCRSLEAAVTGANWFIGVLNGNLAGQFDVRFAEQFALSGGTLGLIRTWGEPLHSVAPLAYVFLGFRSWEEDELLPVSVVSPVAWAYSDSVKIVIAAAAMSREGDTLHVILTNNALEDTVLCRIPGVDSLYTGVTLQWITGSHPEDTNDSDPQNIMFTAQFPEEVTDETLLPPHSVCFLTYTGRIGRPGDVNMDGNVDVLDILQMVGYILGTVDLTPSQFSAADLNGDSSIDILDIVELADRILNMNR